MSSPVEVPIFASQRRYALLRAIVNMEYTCPVVNGKQKDDHAHTNSKVLVTPFVIRLA